MCGDGGYGVNRAVRRRGCSDVGKGGSSEGKGPAREHERRGHRETKLGVKDWAAREKAVENLKVIL